MTDKPSVVAIVGPTASGKTALSISVAKMFAGEIISADSRQVYRGLDLGTGKVTTEEMEGIRHHLLDVVDPMDVYTASDFKRDANVAIADIIKRNKLPIVAGGTFFYLDLLRNKINPAPVPPNENFREALSGHTTDYLYQQLSVLDSHRANTIDPHNRQRLIRALEIIDSLGFVPPTTNTEASHHWLIIGLHIQTTELRRRIHDRLLSRLNKGMIDEAKDLNANGVTFERMEELGMEYRYLAEYLQGKLTYDEMITSIETKSYQFAKRQMTWLKRDKDIEWYANEDHAMIFSRVRHFLSA